MTKTSINLVLQGHLPFVKEPDYPQFLEETWFFEGLTETYIPLVQMLQRLRAKGIQSHITLSLSATLISMMQDELLQERFITHLDALIDIGDRELARLEGQGAIYELAKGYKEQYIAIKHFFDKVLGRDLIKALRDLADAGTLSLITTAATHAYLPLYQGYPRAVSAQIEEGLIAFEQAFNRRPQSFWLPECGFYPGLEKILRKHGIRYTYVAAHGALFAESSLEKGLYEPIKDPKSGMVFFPRHYAACQDIWDQHSGYPSEAVYREFYRDIGFSLDMEYLSTEEHPLPGRIFTGYKYYSITSLDSNTKELYDPAAAKKRVAENVENFIYRRKEERRLFPESYDGAPIITVALNADLFGHWWHEGIDWLEQFIMRMQDERELMLSTAEEYIKLFPPKVKGLPALSSWGHKGYTASWLSDNTQGIYPYIFAYIKSVEACLDRYPETQNIKKQALDQLVREMLLSMGSDWVFLLGSGGYQDFAFRQIKESLENMRNIIDGLCQGTLQVDRLLELRKKHSVFEHLDSARF